MFIGAGDLGVRAALELVDAGWQVHTLRRSEHPVPEPLVGHRADITDPAALAQVAWPRADVLVVCVAPGRTDEAAYRSVYGDGVTNVLTAVCDRGLLPARVVFVSTTAVYGQRDGEMVDESAPTSPSRFNGAVMVEAERQIASCGAAEHVVARLGGIYGPGRTRFVDRVRAGAERVGGATRDACTNRIHVDDAARAITFLVTHPDPPTIVNVVDDEPARRSIVVRWLAQRLAVAVPVDGDRPTAVTRSSDRVDDKRVSNARLRSLGFELRYPTFRDGYAAVLAGSTQPGS